MNTQWMKFFAPAVLGAIAMSAAPAMAQDNVSVVVNGSPVQFSGQGPVENGQRVLVPLRGVLEKLGAYVDYDSASQEVRAVRNQQQIVLPIGGYTAQVNGNPVKLDTPATVLNGSTMVPLRFVAEALGAAVDYSGSTQTVTINAGGGGGGMRPNPAYMHRDDNSSASVNVDSTAYRAGLIQGRKDHQAGLPGGYREVFATYIDTQRTEFERGYRRGTAEATHDPTSIPRPAPRPNDADNASSFGYKQAQRDFLTKMIADPSRAWPDYRAQAEVDYRAGYRAGWRS